jgi:hypothetical protein
MYSTLTDAPLSPVAVRGHRFVTAIPVLFLAFDAVMKLFRPAPVTESFIELGYAPSLALGIGVLELACLALYLMPRTSILGAVLLTGYLGGAVATHVRVGSPILTHTLFPVYVGLLIWLGIFLADARVRELLPVRRPE